jgi:single-strand DNA-binding protein
VNKVMLIGNATRNGELRHTHSGKPVASIRLATNRMVRGSDGASREEAQYHGVVCWDTLAETTSRYVKKGDPLYVEGRLEYRTYTDSDGQTRGAVEIVAADVQFLGKRRTAEHQPAEALPGEVTQTSTAPAEAEEEIAFDELAF